MNVLHINESDVSGGAAIAAYRLHQGLLAKNFNSRMLVGEVKNKCDRVVAFNKNYIEEQLYRFAWRLGLNCIYLLSTFDIPKHSFYKEADILNFHNLHTAYFNYLAIPKLTENKPAIFTLHDMWSFTGHCAYSYNCERWKNGCGRCPYPDTPPIIGMDNTRLEWKLKNWVYSNSNLTIVTPSHWLKLQAQQSLLNRFSIHHIPYGINTEVFQPLDPEKCRYQLNIPISKKVLMFGAVSLTDPRKGGDLLLKALSCLPQSLKAETLLLTMGYGGKAISEKVGIPSLNLGYVNSDHLKSVAYSAADLFICPTRADNLPLVLQESMACGTPIVAFKVGGIPDLVRPEITGYLAQPEESDDLCNGVMQLLADENLRQRMRRNCRKIATTEYSLELQAQKYIDLYRQVLQS